MSAPGKPPRASRDSDFQTQAQPTGSKGSMAASSFSPCLPASSFCQPAQSTHQVPARHQAAWLQQSADSYASMLQPLPGLRLAKRPGMLLCSRHTSLIRTAAAGTTTAGSADRRLAVKLSLAQSSGKLDLSEFELDSVPSEVFALAGLEVSITKGGCPLLSRASLEHP